MITLDGDAQGRSARGAPDLAMLLPPSPALLMPPGPLLSSSLGAEAESGLVIPEEVAAGLARAKQVGLVMSTRLRDSAVEHAPEMRRQATLAAQSAGKGASAALVAAVEATGTARQAWAAAGARPGLRRNMLLGGLAALAVVLAGGWLMAKQQATFSARREVPAALARLGLTSKVSYADLTASPSGSVTLKQVTWRDGPQVLAIDSITVGDIAQGPAGLRRGDLAVRGMAVPIGRMRDSLPPGLGNMLLGLGYVAPRVDVDASFDIDDSRRMLTADVVARSAGLGSAATHLRVSGSTTAGLVPLVEVYAQKFGMQPDRRFGPDGMFAMQAAQRELAQLALVEGSLTLDDAPLAARAAEVPARSMPDEAPSPDEQERTQRFLAGLGGIVAPDDAAAAQLAAAYWLKNGGRLVVKADPANPVPFFTGGDEMEPGMNLDNPASMAPAHITMSR